MLYQVETQPVIAQTVLLVDMAMRNRCRMRCALGRVCQVSIALAIPLMSKVKVVQLGHANHGYLVPSVPRSSMGQDQP